MPERADATDATRVVELEHVNPVERHRTVVGHAIDGPHHCRLAYRIAYGILLGRVTGKGSEPSLSVAGHPRSRVRADRRLQHNRLGHFSAPECVLRQRRIAPVTRWAAKPL